MKRERKEFRRLLSVEEALELVFQTFRPRPLGVEKVPLLGACGRVLAEDVVAPIDVPPFDRAAMDGYAVRAEDVEGADELKPVKLKVKGYIEAGQDVREWVGPGEAVEVATGAPLPPGADAVVMVEHTLRRGNEILVMRGVPRGANVYHTGADVVLGEVVLYRGSVLGPAEIAVLASLGYESVNVYRKPRVAVISVGNELVEPGAELPPYRVYDANSYSIAAAVYATHCEPILRGIVPDDLDAIRRAILEAVECADVVITSGGTSAGRGDYVYRVLEDVGELLIHGLKIKPGKPTVVASVHGKPVIGLPGYPLSALMAFQLIAKPLLEAFAGVRSSGEAETEAVLASRVIPAKGRVNLIPVMLRKQREKLLAFPLSFKSGAVEALLLADAFLVTGENEQYLDKGEVRKVQLLRPLSELPDIAGIGSHCMALEIILAELRRKGYRTRYVARGSSAAFLAVREGGADFGGTHLLDPSTGEYNRPFMELFGLQGRAVLIRGYLREQGFIVREGNPLQIKSFDDIVKKKARFINRVRGSGTRALIDSMLRDAAQRMGLDPRELEKMIPGFNVEAKSHTAVAAAVKLGRADVGVGIRAAAEAYGLSFVPIGWENYDFVVAKEALKKRPVQAFIEYLASSEFRERVEKELPGYKVPDDAGEVIAD